ncbi:MAG: glycine cleavage system protein GcvH [Alphaproteobacteria bacterium]|nr:glycine cleavage system protein GcvH [Alphaproteobacteria bacterium]
MADYKYTKDHECVFVDGQDVWVGISSYAREALGDLVYVELPEVGKSVSQGDDIAVIESVKTAAEVYAPVAGEVIAVNEAMPDDLDLIAKPVEQGGWIVKLKVADSGALDALMNSAAYEAYLKEVD